MGRIKLLPFSLLLLLSLLLAATSASAIGRYTGYVERGGQTAVTALTGSTAKFQRSYPGASVLVLIPSTSTPATIYSDAGVTVIPGSTLTADSTGSFTFYAAEGDFDLRFSGGGITSPFTRRIQITAIVTTCTPYSYGAKGDGSTDDTAALALTTLNCVHVNLGTGNYKVTAPILFYGQQEIFSDSISATRGGTITLSGSTAALKAATQLSANTRDVRIHDLTINNSNVAAPAGSIGIDFRAVSNSVVERVSLRYHEKGIRLTDPDGFGNYFNHFQDVSVIGCTNGYYFSSTFGSNMNYIIGGVIKGNGVGLYIDTANNVSLSYADVDSNGYGVRIGSLATECVIGPNNHFEANTTAALQFSGSASRNMEFGNQFSNSTDKVYDISNAPTTNISWTLKPPSQSATQTGFGSGQNMLPNADMEIDANADGIVDGWAFNAGPPGTMVPSIDLVDFHTGVGAQKINLTAASAQRTFSISAQVIPFATYVFTGWHKTSTANDWKFGIGTSPGATQYQSVTIASSNSWEMERVYFQVGNITSISIWAQNLNTTGATALWLDTIKLEPGLLPTAFWSDSLATAKQTVGPNVASAATTAISYSGTHVTGTATINSWSLPGGFSGPFTVIADGAWATSGAGNIPDIFTAVAGNAYSFFFDPITSKCHHIK